MDADGLMLQKVDSLQVYGAVVDIASHAEPKISEYGTGATTH